MQELAPIVLFVYNRPWHTQKTVEALLKNKLANESNLFIFADGPKNEEDSKKVSSVRSIIKSIRGFRTIQIIERERNWGLADSVIKGVTEVIDNYGKVIVLEDDILSSTNFLKFINDALQFYENDNKIFSISGYTFPIKIPSSYPYDVFIMYRSSSWGWATWKNRWDKVDWEVSDFGKFLKNKDAKSLFNRGGDDLTPMLVKQMKGKIDSWAIRWAYAHYKEDAFCLYPVISNIKNIGIDNTGTHSTKTKKFEVVLDNGQKKYKLIKNLTIDESIIQSMKRFSRLKFHKKMFNYIRYRL